MTTIVWFRQDLRLSDHPALAEAAQDGAVVPLYIWEPEEERPWQPGGASRWWLHHSLCSLDQELGKRQSRLIVRSGPAMATLEKVISETQASRVVWSRRYEPHIIKRDELIKKTLKERGIAADSFNGSLLFEPMDIRTKEGKPYQVYTPFWKACLGRERPRVPLAAPKRLTGPAEWPESRTVESLELLPRIKWDQGFYQAWSPGEVSARKRLMRFCEEAAGQYADQRDVPGVAGTSRLSAALHFGEVSPQEIWQAISELRESTRDARLLAQTEVYQKELVWREFAYHLLYHFPHTPTEPLRSDFARFPWVKNDRHLQAWQRGMTGYPLVDAGMRELWTTGWMHNRVRMVVASFLVKHLLLPWQAGAAWFWDTLVDADLASNTLGWQWTAGCGADAAPYFRVFNPMQQGERFDPQGKYVRRWVPELAGLSDRYLHSPWTAPAEELKRAGVILGKSYPQPLVEHAEARKRALGAYEQMRKGG